MLMDVRTCVCILAMLSVMYTEYHIAQLLTGQNIDGCTSLRSLTTDRYHLRPPVLAIATTRNY